METYFQAMTCFYQLIIAIGKVLCAVYAQAVFHQVLQKILDFSIICISVIAGISLVVTECFMVCRYVVDMCLWLSLFKPTISCDKYNYKSSCEYKQRCVMCKMEIGYVQNF